MSVADSALDRLSTLEFDAATVSPYLSAIRDVLGAHTVAVVRIDNGDAAVVGAAGQAPSELGSRYRLSESPCLGLYRPRPPSPYLFVHDAPNFGCFTDIAGGTYRAERFSFAEGKAGHFLAIYPPQSSDTPGERSSFRMVAQRVAADYSRWHDNTYADPDEAKFRAFFARSSRGVVVHRGIDVLFANDALADMLGYASPAALIAAKRLDSLIVPRTDCAIDGAEGYLSGGLYRTQTQRKDGAEITLELSSNSISWDGGAASLATVVDVTASVRRAGEMSTREALYRSLVEGSIQGLVIHKDRKPLFSNHAYARMLGYDTASDVLAIDSLDQVCMPEQVERLRQLSIGQQEGRLSQELYETRNIRRDGGMIDVVACSTPIEWDGEVAIQTAVIETTKLKQAERDAQAQTDRLRSVVSLAPIVLWSMNPDGKITLSEGRGLEHLNSTPGALVGQSIFETMRDYPEFLHCVRRALAGEMVADVSAQNGRIYERWFEPIKGEFSEILGVLGLSLDITARVRAERSDRGNRRLLQTVINTLPHFIFVTDASQRFQLVNLAYATFYGQKTRAIMGRAIRGCTFLSNAERTVLLNETKRVLRTGERISHSNRLVINAHGEQTFHNEIRLPLRGDDGAVTGVVTIVEDNTARKRDEEELGRYREHLEDLVAERTAALEATNAELESFTDSVSHDLRAPLRTINGFSLAMIEDYSTVLPPDARDYLQRVYSASERMGHLIDDLLRLSRVSRREMELEEVSLSDLVGACVQELTEHAPNAQHAFAVGPHISTHGDPGLLRVALSNLLGNAWKYAAPDRQANIEFGVETKNQSRTFYVRDNGVGFDMKHSDRIFAVFQRLHPEDQYEGTGVGLATVKRIIHRHQGRIWVDSKPNIGTTVYFTLGTDNASDGFLIN